jgi:hypothetical protein
MRRAGLRKRLLDKVATYKIGTGVWTPERAEAVAKRVGLDRLNPEPKLAEFMDEPFWSFIQAIGWIAWRTPETVREHADRYREEHLEWRHTREGAVLSSFSQKRSTYRFLQTVRLQDDKPPSVAVEDAMREFWNALLKGDLVANALDVETGKRRRIERMEFQDLKLGDYEHVRDDGAGPVTLNERLLGPVYWDPRVESVEVRELWPAPASPTIDTSGFGTLDKSSAKAESDCRRWLEGEMRKSPHQRPKGRRDFRAEALSKFAGLSGRAFDRAWEKAIEATGAKDWARVGRPKKSPQ